MRGEPMNDLISRAVVVDAIEGVDWYHQNQHGEMVHGANPDEHQAWYKAEDIYKAVETVPSAQPGCEDVVPRTSVEYICQKNTVSTNPYEHKYHDKFIQFMDDPEISDFGRWQHSNGFNTALVAVKCDLDKVPSVTPAQPGWIPCSRELPKPNEEDGNGFYKAYLVQDGRWMDVARWDGKYWIAWGYSTVLLNVVAWMPLPTPYREGGQDNGSD